MGNTKESYEKLPEKSIKERLGKQAQSAKRLKVFPRVIQLCRNRHFVESEGGW